MSVPGEVMGDAIRQTVINQVAEAQRKNAKDIYDAMAKRHSVDPGRLHGAAYGMAIMIATTLRQARFTQAVDLEAHIHSEYKRITGKELSSA